MLNVPDGIGRRNRHPADGINDFGRHRRVGRFASRHRMNVL
jgi:hypothetical protein